MTHIIMAYINKKKKKREKNGEKTSGFESNQSFGAQENDVDEWHKIALRFEEL